MIYLARESSAFRMAVVRHWCRAEPLGLVLDQHTGSLQSFLYVRLLAHSEEFLHLKRTFT